MSKQQFLGEIKWVGASYTPGSAPGRAGPATQGFPKMGHVFKGFDIEYLLYQHSGYRGVNAKYTVAINKRLLVVDGRAANIWIGYTPKKDGKLFVRVVLNHTKVVYDGPAASVSVTSPEKKFFSVTPDGKGFIELDYLSGTEGLGQAEEEQQRLTDFLDGEAKLTPGSKQFLGEVGWLGAVPWQVAKWFSSNIPDWDKMSAEQQQALLDAAKQKEAAYQGFLQNFKNQGACDGTKPGLLAGALKQKLIAAGADKSKLDSDPDVFGTGECDEWFKIFGKSPTAADAAAAWQYGGNTFGGIQVPYKDVCPSPKLPVCGGGGGAPGGGGGGGPECSPTKPCPPGYECCQPGWTAGDFGEATPGCTPGKCVQKCPGGYTRGSDGACKAVSTGGGSSSSGPGLLILGAAALGLAFVASKSQLEKIPQRAAGRLLENKRRRRRRY